MYKVFHECYRRDTNVTRKGILLWSVANLINMSLSYDTLITQPQGKMENSFLEMAAFTFWSHY